MPTVSTVGLSRTAREALVRASIAARQAPQGSLAPLLYGLTATEEGLATGDLLWRNGITVERVSAALGLDDQNTAVALSQDLALGDDIAAVVARARELAASFDHEHVGPEHLLLALVERHRSGSHKELDMLDAIPSDPDALRPLLFGGN